MLYEVITVHPESAERTVTLKRLERDLAADPSDLRERISALGLMDVVLEPWEDVVDPAGGDLEVFSACAHEINDLLMEVLPRL